MKTDNKNDRYRQELNQIQADEVLKKRILSKAEKRNGRKSKRSFIFSTAVLLSGIIITTVIIKNADIIYHTTDEKDLFTSIPAGKETNPAEEEEATMNQTASHDVNMNVIFSGNYGEKDFKVVFEYHNKTDLVITGGKEFTVWKENPDGSYSVYKPEIENFGVEEIAWEIQPGEKRTEDMTRAFLTGYPELTGSIMKGMEVKINTVMWRKDENDSFKNSKIEAAASPIIIR